MPASSSIRAERIARAGRTVRILALQSYAGPEGWQDLAPLLAASCAGVRLVSSDDWPDLIATAKNRCTGEPAPIFLTEESTTAAVPRLGVQPGGSLAALNFAAATRRGGGWDTGSGAQEEGLCWVSGLIPTLNQPVAAPYYDLNRAHDHPFYTDHALWSPSVPFFADDREHLLPHPIQAGLITMPAPNLAGLYRMKEHECLVLPSIWAHRIRCVLALAITQGVRRLILGAWGCGAFGNDPILVSRCFQAALHGAEPWRCGFDSITFALIDRSPHQANLRAFRAVGAAQEWNIAC